jgi:NADH-quinone oxidoreductase subunit F
MIESIEGSIGEPRAAYVYPTERGLWGKPTVMNNVETFINIPSIIRDGGENFARIGTETSKGTKVFSVCGKVVRTGLVEVPMGTTLREIVFDICDGMIGNRQFKAVQTGGPSGGCLPESLLDTKIDYDSLMSYNSMMGSGGMIVLDEWTCMVELARYNVEFLAKECCGACVSCREGLRTLLDILNRICNGKGVPEDMQSIQSICDVLAMTSSCGLGKTESNHVISTMRHFADEYREHIVEKRCRTRFCRMGAKE